MTRKRWSVGIVGLLLLGAGWGLYACYHIPKAWTQLQQWARTAETGELYTGNPQLAKLDGRALVPFHTQAGEMKFLFSDSPEYLYRDALGKGLACMRLTEEATYLLKPETPLPFGAGIYYINKVTDPDTHVGQPATVSLVVRALKTVTDGGKTHRNTRSAVVRLTKGASGESDVMPMFAGKACATAWFTRPNVVPVSVTLRPGEAKIIYANTLSPDVCLNAMLDLDATNAYYLKVYVVFETVKDYEHLAFAPYGMTIGTNSGTGNYWKRILRPVDGTPPFDPSDTRHLNKVHLRFVKMPPEVQYLVDETWNLRPENEGKKLVRRKGGQRRPFKGDYNVDYTVVIPIRASRVPASFALVDVQRLGMFGGAIRTSGGDVVQIPTGPTTSIHTGAEGVLLERVRVTDLSQTEYRFHWLLPGGSYGDQAFMLVPLGDS
jgi:hypothetical protein